ncbi:SGNH/GDSL hydrolase family protein [Agrobacterium tumefaciens]|uniref:SGNH/GDSL hydrolase family protein n=1 Tax=Agrobacterium tumefaciens TaxID=358 RepID=UPI0015748EA9|nr:SGNH/GDSL hydrolase family protein [Agrobacterium tumefaciens]NTD88010.1 SGNH/GDSL hydrolase family protein [Agrobacterium tumefaciens]NTD88079.1 SGNH/GDSL hydrolase family protein [Agrobacterium tumefaciens]NTD92319.1 SGNH/GDSL hydrolase family protein [Agrobacterium tumefaciens]NTD92388.1 SGNH/GDSL hydrolase family protein [Agrobacterium tumefaciens]NTD99501.1 SGNH/GDSL hydrolase family protein [Agrobacterium tumefaciens]
MSVSLPRASRIAVLGTSLVQQNHIGDASSLATSARGWMSWAEVLSHGRLCCPVHHDPSAPTGWEPSNRPGVSRFFSGLNFGVSGQKAIEIERRLPRLLQSDFDLVIVDAGTNDMMVETGQTIADTRARIVSALLDAGKTVILLPILARGTGKWPAGGAERAKAHWINRQSIEFAADHANCHVFDWNSAWVDPESEFGEPHPGYSDDGTHFAVTGAFAVGKLLTTYLEAIVPRAPARILATDDRFDPVDNPAGNLASDFSALTVKETGEQSHRLGGRLVHPGTGLWVEAICDVDVPAHCDVLGISLRLKDASAEGQEAVALAPFCAEDGTFFPFPATQWTGALRTPPLKLRPGEAPPEVFLDVILRPGSQPIEIDVNRIEVRSVSSPVRR